VDDGRSVVRVGLGHLGFGPLAARGMGRGSPGGLGFRGVTARGSRSAPRQQQTAEGQQRSPKTTTLQHTVKHLPSSRDRVARNRWSGSPEMLRDYFCQVRFLWRFARSFLRRLCLLIFALRRFFNEPIIYLFLFVLTILAEYPGNLDECNYLLVPKFKCGYRQ
jgi:hypothetical protein